jgi:hypothetical protein
MFPRAVTTNERYFLIVVKGDNGHPTKKPEERYA